MAIDLTNYANLPKAPTGYQTPGGVAGSQQIGGQTYRQYTPEWYAAQRANEVNKSATQGTAAGAAIKALREQVPDLFAPNFSTSTGTGMSGAGAGPTFQGPGGGTFPSAQLQMPDMSAANAAQFARAKDQVGQTSRGAITGLQQALAGRGMLGSGQESRGITQAVQTGQQQLGETSREQAIQGAGQAMDVAKTGYQGGITQRGQDIGAAQNANEFALRKWQTDMENERAMMEMRNRYSQQQSQSLAGLLGAFGGQSGMY